MVELKRVREFLNSPRGRLTGAAVCVLAVLALLWSMRGALNRSDAAAASADRMFIDATNGKPFRHELQMGETVPVKAPSGELSGYPAELCYWTKDGQIKDSPTAVLMNSYKGVSGPTFCPDCGRLVVPHNPKPLPGTKPPPSQAEYAERHSHRDVAPVAPPAHDDR